jgi:glycosyltransferase involved in cell wall biosynthesis
MNQSLPIVSVLMTSYNRENYIGESIESVLTSTFKDFELIIVDDCSSDSTLEIAKIYEKQDSRIKVYQNEKNLGDYPNRNKAASYAIGKYIKYLDSDDVMYPHCLEVMVSSMEKYPNAAFGLSSIGNEFSPYPHCISPQEAYKQHFNGFGHFNRAPGSAIIKQKIFEKEKGFHVPKYAGDTELWFRLAQRYDLVLFPRDLVWDRCHSQSQSNLEKKDKKIIAFRQEIIKDMLNSPSCPLLNSERLEISIRIKKNLIKNTIKKWL